MEKYRVMVNAILERCTGPQGSTEEVAPIQGCGWGWDRARRLPGLLLRRVQRGRRTERRSRLCAVGSAGSVQLKGV